MRHVGDISKEVIKEILTAEVFYPMMLPDGHFGKHTGDGWHAWNGLCPFHDDRTAGSFYINKKTGAFKCFSCGAGGSDIFDFHMQKEHLTFKDSFKRLQEVARCVR